MTQRSTPQRSGSLRALGHRAFFALPKPVRNQLVRWGTPSYTLGALVLLRDAEDRLLLVQQPPGHGWSLPGGLANRGEPPVVAAARELAEETGIKLSPKKLELAQPNALISSSKRWVDAIYTAKLEEAQPELNVDGEEILQAAWYTPEKLPPLTTNTARILANYGIGPYVEYV